jgi:hypothetical protein
MSNDARNQMKLFSMGAAVLMIAATEVLVGYHYFQMLKGFARIALIGLLVVAWVIIWSTWWSSKAGEDTRVRWTSYVVALGVSVVMIFNGAMVIADLYLNQRVEKEETADLSRIEARGKAIAEVKRAGGSWRDVREMEKANREVQASRLKMDEPTKADIEQYRWVKDYVSFWIFFVPFAAALAGKFLLLGVIALPGGASGYIPTAPSAPSSRPGFTPPPSGGGGGGLGLGSMANPLPARGEAPGSMSGRGETPSSLLGRSEGPKVPPPGFPR